MASADRGAADSGVAPRPSSREIVEWVALLGGMALFATGLVVVLPDLPSIVRVPIAFALLVMTIILPFVVAGFWLIRGWSVFATLGWFLPFLGFQWAIQPALPLAAARAAGLAAAAGLLWICCTRTGSRFWFALTETIRDRAFHLTLPAEERRFHGTLRGMLRRWSREGPIRERPWQEQVGILTARADELDRLDPPNQDWARLRDALVTPLRLQAAWYVDPAARSAERVEAAIAERQRVVEDVKYRRSWLYRLMGWTPRPARWTAG